MSAPSKPKTKSNLVLSRVTIDDVPDLCRAFNLSFTHPFNQHTFPWSADSEKWWHKFYANAILKDPQGTHVMKVVDTNTTGKLVAFARWVMPAGTGSGNLAEEDRWPKYSKDFDAGLCDVMFGTFDEMRKKHMGDRPHYFIELLGTISEYAGQGAGSMLVNYGCEMADRDGLEAYVDSSPEGRRLYERFGFRKVEEREMPGGFDFLYGFLIRPAKEGRGGKSS